MKINKKLLTLVTAVFMCLGIKAFATDDDLTQASSNQQRSLVIKPERRVRETLPDAFSKFANSIFAPYETNG